MSTLSSCRLCLAENNGNHLDIFGVTGIEKNISEIIAEHFKCEIRSSDSLPNFVCEMCWRITEAFHELYQKSKVVHEKLLTNPPIKIEADFVELWASTKVIQYMEEPNIDIEPIKVEPNSELEHDIHDLTTNANDESDSNANDPVMDFDENTDSDENSSDESSSEDDNVEPSFEDIKEPTKEKSRKRQKTVKPKDKPTRKKEKTKVVKGKFEKLFAENKHLFDMSCDLCPTIFKTLYEAKNHYVKVHKRQYGYIKCCNQRLVYPSTVLKHFQRHLDPNKYKCSQCDKVLLCDRQLAKHIARHKEAVSPREKTLSCNICLKSFTTPTGLANHMKKHKERPEMDVNHAKFIDENFDMKCDHCDTIFTGFHDARRHYKMFHNEEKGYLKCCNVKLRELWIVSDHIKSHLDPTSFSCDQCDKTFTTRVILVQHKRRHRLTLNKNFVCDYCGKCVRDKDAMLRHMFTNHVDVEPTHECNICHKKFRLPQLLKNHFYSVHREKKVIFVCDICGKAFHVKFHLDKHMLNKHTDKSERLIERKQCEYCGEWLLTKSGIFYHHQKHTSGIQKCDQCQMEFSNRVALLGHIRQYHREHKFKCGYCNKTFAIGSALKKHEESHTRHNTYPCRFCSKVFSVISSRQTHTKRNHAEEWKQIKEMEKIEKLGMDSHKEKTIIALRIDEKKFRMSDSYPCRLCFSTDTDRHMNIFSDVGIQLKMSEIIGEHFKCEVSEADSLPNFVCNLCWQTTESFHELYQKSKAVQEKFLNPMIKVEVDTIGMWHENLGRDFEDDLPIDVNEIKSESNLEYADVLDPRNDFEEVHELSDRDVATNDTRDGQSNCIETSSDTEQANKPISRRMRAKNRRIEFKNLFYEHKHRFDMTCDLCSHVFDTLSDARNHYNYAHGNPRGYIKCCNNKLWFRCEVIKHIQRHLNPNKYKCNECGKVYTAPHGLKGHIKSHHTLRTEKEWFICDICKKKFASKVGIKRHLHWHTESKKKTEDDQHKKFIAENFDMSCDLCETIFITFHDARRHYKEFHNEKKGYIKCCNIKLRELWIVTDHILSHLNPSNFKCDFCNKSFSSGMRLKQHKGRHRRVIERPFTCDICGKTFRDKETITRHLFTTHTNTEPKFECEICHKRFQLAALLKNHFYSVHREKKAISTCEICGKSFSVKANFDKHMLSHSDKTERLAQRKQCEHCGEWLMTKSGIYYHEQIHTSGIQKCEQCHMELPNKIALLSHIRKYHRERNHKCSYCDKSFPVGSELKKHEEGHTRHNVYPCQFCTKIFTLRTSRLTHQKRSHREELKQLREMRKLMKNSAASMDLAKEKV
ncbi:zinc finger protein 91-like [Contarinia nasturtii]|uniref:zinc finger protein 91-like n=1 Tax=Contarinia nasturtii TaxID=265458 RepID=UPI0012D43ED2|nr:zinc finger protein 91-like [Contarinia nasturtii]